MYTMYGEYSAELYYDAKLHLHIRWTTMCSVIGENKDKILIFRTPFSEFMVSSHEEAK